MMTFLRFRIEVSNRRADRLSKSAHSGPINRLYPQRLTKACPGREPLRARHGGLRVGKHAAGLAWPMSRSDGYQTLLPQLGPPSIHRLRRPSCWRDGDGTTAG